MSVKNLADVTRIGLDVLTTSLSSITGLVSAQLGNVVTNVATSADAEWYFPPGVVARPRKPDAGSKAAQVVTITRSDHDAIVGCRDPRVASIYGALQDGETAVFASVAGGGVAVFKADGSISVTAGTGEKVTIGNGFIVAGTGGTFVSTSAKVDAVLSSLNTFALAVNTYAVAIKAIADPTNAATPALTAAQVALAAAIGSNVPTGTTVFEAK